MSDQSMQPEADRTGSSDHPQHRTPAGEASESPLSEQEPGPAQVSIYDGMGNERVMVTADGEDGRAAQGTGDTAEDAMEDVKRAGGGPLGPATH